MVPAAGSSMPVKHENNANHRLADVICIAFLKIFANDTLRTWLAEDSFISNEDNLHYCKLTIRVHTSHFTKGLSACVPCNLETSRSLQTAPCSLQTACHAVCRLRGHRFNELHARLCFGEITSRKTERIVMIL